MNMAQDVLRVSFHTSGEATTYYADPAGVAVARDSCCWSAAGAAPVGIDGTPSCTVTAARRREVRLQRLTLVTRAVCAPLHHSTAHH